MAASPAVANGRRAQLTDVAKQTDTVTLTIDGVEVTADEGRRWSSGSPSGWASRSRGSATTRCWPRPAPAASAWSRSRASASRSPRAPRRWPTGMVVKTQLTSPVAAKAQDGVMELLLVNHPLDCPTCDKGGECPLQNQAMSNGRADSRFHEHKREYEKPIHISTQVLLDRERCVLCQRCTRFSEEIAGDKFIDLMDRSSAEQINVYRTTSSAATEPATARRRRHGDVPFNSYFSGNTIQICPVGALTGEQYRFRARPFDLVSTPSACEHCAAGCAHARRPPPRQGAAPAGRRRPGGERGVELRQGPVGLPVRHRATTGSPPRWSATRRPVSCARRPGARRCWRRPRGCRPPAAARRRRAHRRPAHGRGRVRVREVRPGRAGHQRHRLPGPAGSAPRRPTSWPPRSPGSPTSPTPTWRTRPPR